MGTRASFAEARGATRSPIAVTGALALALAAGALAASARCEAASATPVRSAAVAPPGGATMHLRAWGLTLAPLSANPRSEGPDAGVVVRAVAAASPALEAGVRPGDVITAIDGNSVRVPDDARRRLVDPSDVRLSLRRGSATLELPMRR